MLTVCVLGSGSQGNCTLVSTERTSVLVDLGFARRSLSLRLERAHLAGRRIDALLLTHGHADHICGALSFAEEHAVPVFMNEGTRNEVAELQSIPRWEAFQTGCAFRIGDLRIEPFAVSHDAADPVGFRFSAQGIQGALLTDTGELNGSTAPYLAGCAWLILESNHDEEMVKTGPYPWALKQRLLGRKGHLSNQALSRFLSEQFDGQARHIFLAHLSRQNNDPRIALDSASRALAARSLEQRWRLHLTHQSKPSIVLGL